MDELIKQLGSAPNVAHAVTLLSASLAIASSFLLSLVIVFTYRATHQGTSYSQAYVHTLVLMAVVTSVIMLIIGSNIARAFSLVGALSIIRFRSAVKDTRDVGFIFFSMAVGMASGTSFYGVALLATLLISAIVFFLRRFDIGGKHFEEVLLKVIISDKVEYERVLRDAFYQYLEEHVLLSIENIDDNQLELVYSVKFKKGSLQQNFIEALRTLPECKRTTLIRGLQNVNV